VQFAKWQLNEPNTALSAPYGESIHNSAISIENAQGEIFDLATFKGKPIFINFWASWCVPCLAEMPSIKTLKTALPNVEFVLVTSEPKQAFLTYMKKADLDLNHYRLLTNVPTPLNHSVLPASFMVNEKGVVVFRQYGAVNWDAPETLQLLKEAIQ
jgi:thiol-disulfide isomerase/thioredoxin